MDKRKLILNDKSVPYSMIILSIIGILYFAVTSYLPVQSSQPPVESESLQRQKITIRWSPWLRTGEIEALMEIKRVFNEKHSEIEIEIEPLSVEHYERRILVDFMAGRAPDVFYASEEFLQLLARDMKILDLTSYYNSWDESGTFMPDSIQIGSRNERLYGIPVEIDIQRIYYNEDKLSEYGLLPLTTLFEQGDWNWNSLKEAAKNLSSDDGENRSYGLVMRNWWATNYSFIHQNGGEVFDVEGWTIINSDSVRETVMFLRNMIDEGALLYIEAAQKDVSYMNMFKEQKAAMVISGGWAGLDFENTIFDFKWGVVPLPAGRGAQRSSSIVTTFVCINKDSEHREQAWEFIEFFAGQYGQRIREQTGTMAVMPSRRRFSSLDDIHGNDDFKYGTFIPWQQLLWPEMGRSINQGFEQIWSADSGKTRTYLGQLAAEVNAQLEKMKEAMGGSYVR